MPEDRGWSSVWNPIFKDLFIFEMANNHQGNLEHGINIIREVASIAEKFKLNAAIKFQYRQLDTFIHPDFVNDTSNKHISRFLGTKLSLEQFETLIREAKNNGLWTACTPFDEASVGIIEKQDIDIIKIGSCSARDKPLLRRVSDARKPIVCSTAGASVKDLDFISHLFEGKKRDFAFMHCVALYPTHADKMALDRIDFLRHRYHVPVGFSTHESPDDFLPVRMAVAKGARLFERHVGKEAKDVNLNAYSSTAALAEKWVQAALDAMKYCNWNSVHDPLEIASLRDLERGVFLSRDVRKGDKISREDVFFAMPRKEGQMSSGEFRDGIVASQDIGRNAALPASQAVTADIEHLKAQIIQEAKSLLRSARIPIGTEYEAELSHHYGIEKMPETGLVMINCMDRDYCKKLLIQLPGQMHPEHHHLKKEECFQVLYGTVHVVIDGMKRVLRPGDKLLIKPGQKHSFSTETGAVIEEVSTKYEKGGSVYTDPSILSSNPDTRKTYLGKW